MIKDEFWEYVYYDPFYDKIFIYNPDAGYIDFPLFVNDKLVRVDCIVLSDEDFKEFQNAIELGEL